MKRIRSLGIVIFDNKIVLIHRKVNGNEYFVFPGGGVEPGETNEECVIREVREETSIEVKVEKLLYSVIDEKSEHYFYSRRKMSNIQKYSFVCSSRGVEKGLNTPGRKPGPLVQA